MNDNYDLLYIAFIDLNDIPKSGSGVRPQKMLDAFKALGIKVKVLDGQNNQVEKRKKNVKEILKWLKTNRPKMCYVEPPSGPLFCVWDLKLLKTLCKMDVPIALFYRDAYWRFPEFASEDKKQPFVAILKNSIIKFMQKRDWHVFQKVCTHIFFPSETMSEYFNCKSKSALPPGCADIEGIDFQNEVSRILSGNPLHYFYVGGASFRYGTKLLLDTFKAVNVDETVAKLTLVCPEEQWNAFRENIDLKYTDNWLELIHTNDPVQLRALYKKSDVCLVPLIRNTYNDFAVPIKLFEYISYFKPVVTTNCIEMSNIVKINGIGWTAADNVNSLSDIINILDKNRAEIITVKVNCRKTAENNTWTERAKSVIEALS